MSPSPLVPIWKSTPFLRIAPPFILGVLFAPYLPHTKELALILLSLPAIYLSITYRNSATYHFRYGALNGVMINLALLAAGLFCVGQQDIRRQPDWLGHRYASGDLIVVQIQEPLRQGEKSYFTRAKVNGIIRHGQSMTAKGWLLLTISKQVDTLPQWGDILLIDQPIETLHRSGNPGVYDRTVAAFRRHIYHQTYLVQQSFLILHRKGPPLLAVVSRIRERLLESLRRFIPGKKEAGLAEALLVGYKQDLDPETVADYTSTGIVHVIAISGMHLGIIYLLLHALLQKLPGRGLWKGLKASMVLMGIWGFSLLAGNGPSVLRSALMYSSLIIGGTMKRNNDSLNALLASAFLLVCIEPEMVYDAGFQLSYLAVLGLLLLHQRIRRLWITPYQWINQCWNLVSLSLAAQLFTFPVSLFHFHQFPTYFLPANLIAVPFTSMLLIGILILLCVSPFTPVAAVFGKVLLYALYSLNACIHFFANLPWGTWQPLQVTLLQCILMYALILLPMLRLPSDSRHKFRAAWAMIFLITVLRIRSFCQAYAQQQLIIYDIPKSSRMEWHAGRTAYYWNTDTISDAPSIDRILNACRQQHRIQKVNRSSYDTVHPVITIGPFRILHLDREPGFVGTPDAEPVDLLLLSGNARFNVPTLAHALRIRQVVIDRSVSRHRSRRWTAAFQQAGVPCHNIVDKGAFVMKRP